MKSKFLANTAHVAVRYERMHTYTVGFGFDALPRIDVTMVRRQSATLTYLSIDCKLNRTFGMYLST